MIADIQTFDCLGRPIEIQIRSKASPKYHSTRKSASEGDRRLGRYGSKAALFAAADFNRQYPDQFADTAEPGEDVEGMCEWAFVIEQLVAEGTL